MNQVCFSTTTFLIVIFLNFLIILWSLYSTFKIDNERFTPPYGPDNAPDLDYSENYKVDNNIMLPKSHHMQALESQLPEILPPPPELPFIDVGYIFNKKNSDEMMKLMERYLYGGKYEYYTTHHLNHNLKIPLYTDHYEQLQTGDYIKVPGYKNKFKVNIYPKD